MSSNGSRMKGIGRAMVALPVLLSLVTALDLRGSNHASAGSANDPEIVDACPETMPDEQMPFADICAAWFEADWTPIYDEQGGLVAWDFAGLRTTLEMAGNVDARQPRTWAYALAWQAGECRNLWYLRDIAGADPPLAVLGEICPDSERYFRLEPEDMDISGSRIVVILSRASLSRLSTSHTEGTELMSPSAHVQVNLEVDGLGQTTQDWEEAGPGRSFLIGQDKPSLS